ncbi:MAG: short-chain fatty acyl-CoA regulator family protein [Myxococcota bacterium]
MQLGGKVRALRRRRGLTQARMAEQLGISASYLNLIERDKRPLTAPVLIKILQTYEVDLTSFSTHEDARLTGDLMEIFGDDLFESHDPSNHEIEELVSRLPGVGRAVVDLYRSYRDATEQLATLRRMVDDQLPATDLRLPSDEVTAFIERYGNHFPELETAAEAVSDELEPQDRYPRLVRRMARHGVVVRIADAPGMRTFDPDTGVLTLAEGLPPSTRDFQLAVQLALIEAGDAIDAWVAKAKGASPPTRTLLRIVLAGYFAGAVLMPYSAFARSARQMRHDLDRLGHRFQASFEQVCHRLCTLHRQGDEGIPFHFVKIDLAGNVSKRFSGSGIRFARFGGACPRWNVSRAFLRPHELRVQVSRMPDGVPYACVARTVSHRHGGHGTEEIVHAVGLGCRLEHAKDWVYADGLDLTNPDDITVPIGVTCRLCERHDCGQRAFPSLQHPLRIDENARNTGFYTTTKTS